MTTPWYQRQPDAPLRARLRTLDSAETRKIGFPGWSTPFPQELIPFLSYELNNYGDVAQDPVFAWHTKDLEREAVAFLSAVFGAGPGSSGHVTSGGADGLMHGLWQARTQLPEAAVYLSAAAHPSVKRVADLLRLPTVVVPTDPRGAMNLNALQNHLLRRQPAIVVATIGTTLTEAVDDVPGIHRVMARRGVDRYYIHADAAFAGLPLALTAEAGELPFGVHEQGVDSLSVSGHKFLGAPFPCGVVISRSASGLRSEQTGLLCGASDLMGSSRNGHAALLLWYRIRQFGLTGLRAQAESALAIAELAVRELQRIGLPAWRSHARALTVVFPSPPRAVLRDWPMPIVGGTSHLVCTPGVTRERIRRFVEAVVAASSSGEETSCISQPV